MYKTRKLIFTSLVLFTTGSLSAGDYPEQKPELSIDEQLERRLRDGLMDSFRDLDAEAIRDATINGRIDFSSRCIPTESKFTCNGITGERDISYTDYLTPVEFAQKRMEVICNDRKTKTDFEPKCQEAKRFLKKILKLAQKQAERQAAKAK